MTAPQRARSWYEELTDDPMQTCSNRRADELIDGDDVSATATPGSRQILDQITRSGTYVEYADGGAGCSSRPAAPASAWARRRPPGRLAGTFNRNFPGRSRHRRRPGLPLLARRRRGLDAHRQDLRPARAFAAGVQERPPARPDIVQRAHSRARTRGRGGPIEVPRTRTSSCEQTLPDTLVGRVLIVAPDDISTGDLWPDSATVMAYRSNVPAIAEFTFQHRDPGFAKRAHESGAEASSSPATTTARARAASTRPYRRPARRARGDHQALSASTGT